MNTIGIITVLLSLVVTGLGLTSQVRDKGKLIKKKAALGAARYRSLYCEVIRCLKTNRVIAREQLIKEQERLGLMLPKYTLSRSWRYSLVKGDYIRIIAYKL